MSREPKPNGLLARIGSTDDRERDSAHAELLSLTMIFVRAAMGRKLRDHRESADVCQSVAASLAQDLQAGRVRFDNESALAGYLHRVVHTKLAMLARHDHAAKRSAPIIGGDVAAFEARAGAGDAPSFMARGDEAHRRLLGGLSDQEQELLRLRGSGWSWDQLAAHTGRDAPALRQQFSRVQKRVRDELDSLGGA